MDKSFVNVHCAAYFKKRICRSNLPDHNYCNEKRSLAFRGFFSYNGQSLICTDTVWLHSKKSHNIKDLFCAAGSVSSFVQHPLLCSPSLTLVLVAHQNIHYHFTIVCREEGFNISSEHTAFNLHINAKSIQFSADSQAKVTAHHWLWVSWAVISTVANGWHFY